MWPSFETASSIYNVANAVFIASLIAGVFATVLLVWMGNVKEAYLRRDVAAANAQAGAANKSAGDANERAAELELKAAQATLEYEKLKLAVAPRVMHPAYQQLLMRLLSASPSRAVIRYPQGDNEAKNLAIQITQAFLGAKWQVKMEERAFTGAGLWVSDNAAKKEQVEERAELLAQVREAFRKAGLDAQGALHAPFTERAGDTVGGSAPPIKVIVGSKPEPQLR